MAEPKPIRMKVKFPTKLPAYLDSERARQIVYDANKITMHGAVNLLHGATVENTPFAFGLLRRSIFGEVLDVSGNIIGKVGTPSPYGAPVEFGSRPHWAPLAPLVLWAQRKLGLNGLFAIAAARNIRYKIAHHGTKGYFMFKRAFNENKGRIRKLFKDAQAATLRKLMERK